jgi:hypothetical protein
MTDRLIAGTDYSIWEIQDANARHGGHFFEPGTMRFFSSRISSVVHTAPEVWLIVTSERNAGYPRRYTVRAVHTNGDVVSLSRFQEFATSRQAHSWAEWKVKELWKEAENAH